MIERNRHPVGRIGNVLFGLAQLGDGLVRVVSLGWCHTRLCLAVTKWQTRKHLQRLKREATNRNINK